MGRTYRCGGPQICLAGKGRVEGGWRAIPLSILWYTLNKEAMWSEFW